jgi:hypothetical protein
VWRIYDERYPDFPRTYRRGGGGSSALPFRRRLAVVNKYEQAASDLRRLGTPPHGQCQSQAVDEEGVVGGQANESSAPDIIRVDRRRIEVAHRIERREVIGSPRKEAGAWQLRARGYGWERRAI